MAVSQRKGAVPAGRGFQPAFWSWRGEGWGNVAGGRGRLGKVVLDRVGNMGFRVSGVGGGWISLEFFMMGKCLL